MALYRVYILDEDGQLEGVLNLDCADDFSAKALAERLADGCEVELWRLVAEFEFDVPRHRPRRRRSAIAHTR
jgi:hypothetical protein